MLSAIASDVRFGLRLYRRSPRFYGLLLVVLVAGIASTTAMFSILDTLLLRPLPFAEPERLVMLQSKRPEANPHAIAYPHFEAMRGARSVTALAVAHSWLHALASEGAVPEGVVGTLVSGEFFQMLGVRPLLGRLIEPADDRAGAEPVVVIGEQLWQRRFQADPSVIGRRVLLDGRPHTIVGVTPERFDFSYPGMEQSSVWTVPEALLSPVWFDATSAGRDWYAMARLAPGVSREDAAAELEALAAGADPDGSLRRTGIALTPLHEAITGDTVDTVWLRFGAIGMAFIVACANVSNLLLVRTESRRAELAARAALGASRRRLVQQLMTETLLLFALAVPLGALCTRWLVQLFASVTVAPKSALSHVDSSIDLRAFWFCVLVCLGAGLAAGLLPAVAASRVDLLSVLKNGSAESRAGGGGGPRAALVVAQVALAFALLSSGGLALMRVNELLSTPLGYEPEGVVDLRLIGVPDEYRTGEQGRELLDRVLARIAAMPQVEAVGAGGAVPLTGYDAITNLGIEGRASTAPLEFVSYNTITRGYLDVMHIPLLRGRLFNAEDERGGEPVALINESLASALFPGQDPIGQRITHPTVEGSLARTIVGVVGNLRRHGPSGAYTHDTYAPLSPSAGMPGVIVVRSDSPERVRRELPQVIASVEPRLGTWLGTLHRRVRNAASDSINVSILLGSFAGITLVLAALGLYAMVSYATVLKTRELGIRSALGSPPHAVLWLVMRSGLWWLAIGSGLGLVAALLLGQTLAARLPGTHSFDLRVYLLVGVSLLGAGSLAAFLPARRAVRASPALALRYE